MFPLNSHRLLKVNQKNGIYFCSREAGFGTRSESYWCHLISLFNAVWRISNSAIILTPSNTVSDSSNKNVKMFHFHSFYFFKYSRLSMFVEGEVHLFSGQHICSENWRFLQANAQQFYRKAMKKDKPTNEKFLNK